MFPFMHINLALNSHFNPMDSSWENKKKVENGGVFEGRTLTCKIEPIPSLKTSIYCLNTIFFMVHLCNSLFFSVMSSSSNSSKVGFFKKRPGKHLKVIVFFKKHIFLLNLFNSVERVAKRGRKKGSMKSVHSTTWIYWDC